MKITYFGHSSFGIEMGGKNILLDPFIKSNPMASAINVDQIKADYVFLTHAHYDHVMDVEEIVNRTKAKIVGNHEIVTYYQSNYNYETHPLQPGGSWKFDFGSVKGVNAIHSSMFPDGSNGGNPQGFIFSSESKNIYFAGDTALTMDMKLIPLFFKLDLAILPLGGNFTMDAEEAVFAAEFVECDNIIGMHYDTAPLIEINHEKTKQMFLDKNKKLTLLKIGESITL